eukprot:633887-Rhodomonas_salina.1
MSSWACSAQAQAIKRVLMVVCGWLCVVFAHSFRTRLTANRAHWGRWRPGPTPLRRKGRGTARISGSPAPHRSAVHRHPVLSTSLLNSGHHGHMLE